MSRNCDSQSQDEEKSSTTGKKFFKQLIIFSPLKKVAVATCLLSALHTCYAGSDSLTKCKLGNKNNHKPREGERSFDLKKKLKKLCNCNCC